MTTLDQEPATRAEDAPVDDGGQEAGVPVGLAGRLRDRIDPAPWGVGALSLVVGLGFLLLNAAYNQGRSVRRSASCSNGAATSGAPGRSSSPGRCSRCRRSSRSPSGCSTGR
jgi:hypothetical protein